MKKPFIPRLRIMCADGEVLEAVRSSPTSTMHIKGRPKITVIPVKPPRFPLVRDQVRLKPYILAEVGCKAFFFPQTDVVFDAVAPPGRGDILLLRRRTDGKIMGVTTPVIALTEAHG